MKKKRYIATALAGFSLFGAAFGLAACNNGNQTQLPNEGTTTESSVQKDLDALKQSVQDLQKDLATAQKDIAALKKADEELRTLITNNMTSVTNSYDALKAQVDGLSALSGDVDTLKTNYNSLNTQLQTLSSSLSVLKSAVDALQQDKTSQKLQETIAQMENKTNLLVVKMAMNLTLNTQFNQLNYSGNGLDANMVLNPNGEFAGSSNNSVQPYVLFHDGYSFEIANGEQTATSNTRYNGMFMSLVERDGLAKKVSDTEYVLKTDENATTTVKVSLNERGTVDRVVLTEDQNVMRYSFEEINEQQYNESYNYVAANIPMVGYYDTVVSSLGKSFDYRYMEISAEMTSEAGSSGTAQGVLSFGKVAQTATTIEGKDQYTFVDIVENGMCSTVSDTNGKIESDTYNAENINLKWVGESLKQAFFGSSFKISYEESTDSYIVSRDDYQVATITIEEDGKINDFQIEMIVNNGADTQTAVYHLKAISRATFEAKFAEIKDMFEELLAKQNGAELGA